MQVHPVALSLSNNRGQVTAELAMRRKRIPKADTRKCVRQDKEKHAKSRSRSTGWTIACSIEWKPLKNPMQKSRFAEAAGVLRTA